MGRQEAFEKLRKQEACPGHDFLPPIRIATSHGSMWRTECRLCGRFVSRSALADLLCTVEEMKL